MKLKMPELEIGIRIQRKDGTVEEYSEPGHSWTRNAWNCAFSCITDATGDGTSTYGAGYMNARRTDAFTVSSTTNTYYRGGASSNAGFSPNAGIISSGIRVGSGDAAFNANATALDTEITNGTSAGQLEHAAFQYPDVSLSSTLFTALLERQFTNSSGGEVSIREIALYNYSLFYSTTLRSHMFARDLLSGAIVLQDTEILEIMYRIRLNVEGMGADGWTRNAWNYVFAAMCDCTGDDSGLFGAGYMSSHRVAGDIYSSPTLFAHRGMAASGNGFTAAADGIRVGTGETAYSVNDHTLETIIASGTGAGQLTHAANSFPALTYSLKKWTATHSRTFTNDSGGSITINEIGLYWQGRVFSSVTTSFMFYRKVLDTPVTITDGNSHTFNVEITMDYGDID